MQKVLSEADLVALFVESCHPPETHRVGLEFEKIGLCRTTGCALPWTGERGLKAMLEDLQCRFDWKIVNEPEQLMALTKGGATLTIEPGGQLELSTPPQRYVDQARDDELRHLEELKSLSNSHLVIWSGFGAQPIAEMDSIAWVLKPRYRVMRDYLAKHGTLGHAMMKATSSIQMSFDYASERDAVQKMQLLMRLAPIMTGMFANSCFFGGELTRFKSYRSHIWQNTDPDRCGIVNCVLKENFSFQEWVQYALDVPLFFIQRHKLMANVGLSFREWLKQGYEGIYPDASDWERHLSTLFPEVRMRRWLEFRSVDRQTGLLSYAAPVMLKALIYNPAALNQATRLLANISGQQCSLGLAEAAQHGMQGQLAGRQIADWSGELIKIAEQAEHTSGDFLSALEKDTLRVLKEDVVLKRECPADGWIRAYEQDRDLLNIVRSSAL